MIHAHRDVDWFPGLNFLVAGTEIAVYEFAKCLRRIDASPSEVRLEVTECS